MAGPSMEQIKEAIRICKDNEIESLWEGIQTDAGLNSKDKDRMRYQCASFEYLYTKIISELDNLTTELRKLESGYADDSAEDDFEMKVLREAQRFEKEGE